MGLNDIITATALLCWIALLAYVLYSWPATTKYDDNTMNAVLAVELICASEVIRIAVGNLRGDLAMSFTVHYTRMLMLFTTIPHPAVSSFLQKMIVLSWAATEVTRYPMVLFPDSKMLRLLRYATPLITFPMGAGGEAFASYLVHKETPNHLLYGGADASLSQIVLSFAFVLVIIVNVGGGSIWYPSMCMKVVKALKGDKTKAKTK